MAPTPVKMTKSAVRMRVDVEVPAVVEGEAGANSGDHAILSRARELATGWVVARRWRRGGGDGRSAGWTETGGWFDLLAAFRAEHGRVSGRYYFATETMIG